MNSLEHFRQLAEKRKQEAEFLEEIVSNWERLEKWEAFSRDNPDILPRTLTLYGGGQQVEPGREQQWEGKPSNDGERRHQEDELACLLAENARLREQEAARNTTRRHSGYRRSVGHLRIVMETACRLANDASVWVGIDQIEKDTRCRLLGHTAFTRTISKMLSGQFAERDVARHELRLTPLGLARARYYKDLPGNRFMVSPGIFPGKKKHIDNGAPALVVEPAPSLPAQVLPEVATRPKTVAEQEVLDLLPGTFPEIKGLLAKEGYDPESLLPVVRELRHKNMIYQDQGGTIWQMPGKVN